VELNFAEQIGPFHQARGAAFTTFTTKKDVSPVPLPVIIPDRLRKSSSLYMKAIGEYSSLTGASLTLGFWFGTRLGVITGDIAVAAAFTTGTTPAAWPWWMEWEGIITGTGAAGTFEGMGQIQFGSSLTAFNAEVPFPVTAAARLGTGFDTTIERAIGVSAAWGASSASNSITVIKHRVVIMNGY
jgi:hypothetical protein